MTFTFLKLTWDAAVWHIFSEKYNYTFLQVRVAALEVYERRALISYDIEGLLHEQINDISAVMFKFHLPEAHPNSSFAHVSGMYQFADLMGEKNLVNWR